MSKVNKKVKKTCIIITILILLILLIIIVNPIKLYNKYQLRKLGYNDVSIQNILTTEYKKEILGSKYNKTLDIIFQSNEYNLDKFNIYKELNYTEIDNYTNVVNILIDKGYTKDELNLILEKNDNESIKDLLDLDYIESISDYLSVNYYISSNIKRYIEYQNNNNISKEKTILYVNIGLDNEFYTNTTNTSEFSYDMLVNKYHGVSDDFIPLNLVNVPDSYGKGEKLNEETLNAFIQMSDDCKKNTGYKLLVRSGYRDLESQQKTYNSYLKQYGKTYTENYVTHPGYSEHHTGLAIDIKASSSDVFINSKESKWTYENAYNYGFILRYQKEYENITGIKAESWHFRYVGLEIAKYIYENNISYEEYYVKFLNNK